MNITQVFELITDIIDQLNVVGVQKDQFKLLVHFLLSFPFSILLRYIQTPHIRKLYVTYIGLFFILYLGAQWIWLVLAETILIHFLSYLRKPFIPICIVSFAVLGYLHYDRFINIEATWKMGFNVVQMMLTCRLVYFGAAAEDRIIKYNFLDYISYIFYFPNIIVGTVPFVGYVDFINLKGVYTKLGYNFKEALKTFFWAFIFVAADQLFRPKFDFNWFASSEWQQLNLFSRHITVQLISMCARFKYFLAFKFSQASMEAGGITFQQNYQLADYRFEIEFNTLKRTKYWNSSVQVWLQNCFYDRYKEFKFALIITFIISAFWHGFYLSYYIFFFEWALFNEITKQFYKKRELFSKIPSIIQYVICIIYGQLAVNATSVPIALLKWDRAWQAMHDLGWVPQIMLVCLYIFLQFTNTVNKKIK